MDYALVETFIKESALILIPVVYILGMFIKTVEFINDKFIPTILLVLSIVLSCVLNGFNIDSIVQGILCAGMAVFFNQYIKQIFKD